MTLQEVIRAIEDAAAVQPAVGMIVENDIFRLNSYADARYGVFAWVQGRHRGSAGDDFLRYSFTLYYVDRLRNDLANQVEVQSVGMTVLQNVLRIREERGIAPETYEFQTFNQRFADECAGVYCSAILLADVDLTCADTFGVDDDLPEGWEASAPDVIIRKY